MKQERSFPKAVINQKAEKSVKGGHPWIFGDDVLFSGECKDGELCDVFTEKERYMGTGFYNSASKIRIRIISRNANDKFDSAFWERRVRYAIDYRHTVMGDDFGACRLIFGEADGFPGLTVDKFEDVLSVQTLSLGIEKIKDTVFLHILNILSEYGEKINVIYERNDVNIRKLEGMDEYKDFYLAIDGLSRGDGKVGICENGIKYTVDYINGQKTGFFLDQKYNRLAVQKICRGKKVLDCFTHTGAFALCAAKTAQSVTAVDISEAALGAARGNAALNGPEIAGKVDFVCADVFALLDELSEHGKGEYDVIILDPPAFTKSSDTLKSAMAGYRNINRKAMGILRRGGYLCTCSCSHFMRDSLFCRILHEAADEAGVSLRQVEARTQSPDHPILWNVPETDYLKFYIFQIV